MRKKLKIINNIIIILLLIFAIHLFLANKWLKSSSIIMLITAVEYPYEIDMVRYKPPVTREFVLNYLHNLSKDEFISKNSLMNVDIYSFDTMLSIITAKDKSVYYEHLRLFEKFLKHGYLDYCEDIKTKGGDINYRDIRNDDLKKLLSSLKSCSTNNNR